jgi:hypothetical protein
MPLPDYHGGSIVNLMASLVEGLGGGATDYAPLRLLPPGEVGAARQVLLLVIDGLGYDTLTGSGAGGVLERHLRGPMTSVFPPTTASAITTYLTAEAPQQHGLTGWHMYFRELGDVLAVLPFRPRHGGSPLGEAGVDVGAFFGHTPVFDRLPPESVAIAPAHIIESDFNRAHTGSARRLPFTGLESFCDAIRASLTTTAAGRRYVYAYWPELDRLAHEHGIASPEAVAHLAALEKAIGGLLAQLSGTDTLVVISADHGFIDTAPESTIDLDDHPGLADCLQLPLCGERRFAYCYVRPGAEADFEAYVREMFAGRARLLESAALLEEGWFGLGEPHPRLRDRIGHYALVMEGNWIIRDHLYGERHYELVGVHGGISERELTVPLVVAEV